MRARGMSQTERWFMLVLFGGGLASLLGLADWWFKAENIHNPLWFGLLSLFFWYSVLRFILIWFNYSRIQRPEQKQAKEGLRVAIFTTSYPGEPLEMIEKTLAACKRINYPHTTYLLDNTQDPAYRMAADKHAAVWIESVNIPGAKAGKINRALEKTSEDFILILDPDHIPFPNFLDETLGYFEDEQVGFVQVSQAYYNQSRSFVARAAAEQTYMFYGPTQMGMHGMGSAVAIGANCTFRRKALESIGGHAVGLAEDLQTSIALHAAGWKSVYNPVVVSRGLVPEDFDSFCKQQLKWARGTFEVLFDDLPRAFKTLSAQQRLSYSAIASYYALGFISAFFTLTPFIFLALGSVPVNMHFGEFLIKGSGVLIFSSLIYAYAQRWLCNPATESGFHWRGMILKYASWPIYLLGFLLALSNKQIPYIPTAKKANKEFSVYARPMLGYIALFLVVLPGLAVYRIFLQPEYELILSFNRTWSLLAFGALALIMSLAAVLAARSQAASNADPWDEI